MVKRKVIDLQYYDATLLKGLKNTKRKYEFL